MLFTFSMKNVCVLLLSLVFIVGKGVSCDGLEISKDALSHVFSFINIEELNTFRLVCKKWKSVIDAPGVHQRMELKLKYILDKRSRYLNENKEDKISLGNYTYIFKEIIKEDNKKLDSLLVEMEKVDTNDRIISLSKDDLFYLYHIMDPRNPAILNHVTGNQSMTNMLYFSLILVMIELFNLEMNFLPFSTFIPLIVPMLIYEICYLWMRMIFSSYQKKNVLIQCLKSYANIKELYSDEQITFFTKRLRLIMQLLKKQIVQS